MPRPPRAGAARSCCGGGGRCWSRSPRSRRATPPAGGGGGAPCTPLGRPPPAAGKPYMATAGQTQVDDWDRNRWDPGCQSAEQLVSRLNCWQQTSIQDPWHTMTLSFILSFNYPTLKTKSRPFLLTFHSREESANARHLRKVTVRGVAWWKPIFAYTCPSVSKQPLVNEVGQAQHRTIDMTSQA